MNQNQQQHNMQGNANAQKNNYMNGGPAQQQAQPHLMPNDAPGVNQGGGADMQSDLLLQLQQIQQYVQTTQPDMCGNNAPNSANQAQTGALGNPEGANNVPPSATPQNILAALADIQKQQPGRPSNFGGQDGDDFGAGGKQGGQDDGTSGQPTSHGQIGTQQMNQQQLVDQKNNPAASNLDLNSQNAANLNPMLYQNLIQQQLQGLGNFNSSAGGLPQVPSNGGGNNSFDLLNLQQMQMGGLSQNYLPNMMPFMPPLQSSPFGGMSGGNSMGGQGGGGGGHGSAASFHQPAEKNQVKLFVGGLAFSTSEQNLQTYFQQFGKVENTIVMRDRMTQRGRGFGFVLLSFTSEDEAQQIKRRIIGINNNKQEGGHYIMDKRVDVKSADDHHGNGERGQMGGGGGMNHGGHQQQNNFTVGQNGQHIQKPNPYCQVEQKGDITGSGEDKDGVKFTYPKSKIFVGGLDFKLTSEELKDHFMKFGEVHDAIILKDIYTGSSRGFGFVTFTQESVAQDLIRNNPVTEINGRRVDIKKAEPKDKTSGGPPGSEDGRGGGGGRGGRGGGDRPFQSRGGFGGGNGGPMGGGHHMGGGNQPAVIPPYGQAPPDRDGGNNGGHGGRGHRGGHDNHRGGMGGGHHRGNFNNRNSSEDKQFDGGNNQYGGGPGGDFRRQGSYGGRQFNDERERGGDRYGGGRGGYDRNGGGHHRGGFNDRRRGGGDFGGNHHNNRGHQNNHNGNGNGRAGSSSSHESGQDSSYLQTYQNAQNEIRKRHQQTGGNDGNRSHHAGGNSHGGGSSSHRRQDNNNGGVGGVGGAGNGAYQGGNRGGPGGDQSKGGYYQQQPSGPAGGSQVPGSNDGANRLNKQQSGGDPSQQRRRFRSRSRE